MMKKVATMNLRSLKQQRNHLKLNLVSNKIYRSMPSTILYPPLATKIGAATMNSAVSGSPATRLSVVTWILEIRHRLEICIVIQKNVGGRKCLHWQWPQIMPQRLENLWLNIVSIQERKQGKFSHFIIQNFKSSIGNGLGPRSCAG